MISESKYKSDFEVLDIWNYDLLKMLVPHSRYNCIGYYKGPTNHSEQENNKELSDCDIIEVLAEISINVSTFQELIRRTGYRVLDSIYGPDYFHFFIKKVE